MGYSPATVRMKAVYDSPTSAEESTAVMVVSALGFARGFYVNLCGGAGWKGRWLFVRTGRKDIKRPARVCKDADQRERVFAK